LFKVYKEHMQIRSIFPMLFHHLSNDKLLVCSALIWAEATLIFSNYFLCYLLYSVINYAG
jgi:hypothetical protein